MSRSLFSALLCGSALLLGVAAVACSSAKQGEEGGSCYANLTCNDGLVCRSELCVDPDNATKDPGDDDSTGGVNIQECLSCGEDSCSAEASACTGSCAKILECQLACLDRAPADQPNCTQACDVSDITQEDVRNLGAYFSCIAQQCISDCVTPPSGGDDDDKGDGSGGRTGGGGGTNRACSARDTFEGGCTTSDYLICEDREWIKGDCTGCGIVTPTKSCERITTFTLLEIPHPTEPGAVDYTQAEEVETTLTQTAASVTAEWYLDAKQVGVIQIVLDAPINASRIEITKTGAVDVVTLENANQTGGCQYKLNSSGRLSRDQLTSFDPYYGTTNLDWNGCWGDYAGSAYNSPSSNPSNLTILNIRTPVATRNQDVSLSITKILN